MTLTIIDLGDSWLVLAIGRLLFWLPVGIASLLIAEVFLRGVTAIAEAVPERAQTLLLPLYVFSFMVAKAGFGLGMLGVVSWMIVGLPGLFG